MKKILFIHALPYRLLSSPTETFTHYNALKYQIHLANPCKSLHYSTCILQED